MSAIAAELIDAKVVDLFAGSGALGIEALSRGASHATFVEQAPRAIEVLRSNLQQIGADSARYKVVRSDAIRFAEGLEPREYDIAFADPPYRKGLGAELSMVYAARHFARILCIEHALNESLESEPIWERRYGDTALSFLSADDG